jgi:branched-chain amino acid transport system substrate-binding protein
VVAVYVSVPLRGASGEDGRDIVRAARLALADADGRAGGLEVRAHYLDDTSGTGDSAHWDPAQVAENAREAAEDSATIAYIGELESGATRTSLPITNEARILHVSPASAALDLVREPGTFDDVPEEAQPSGVRTFGRVIPDDEAQGAAAAGWTRALGVRRVTVVSDGSVFGTVLADAFTADLETVRARVHERDFREVARSYEQAGVEDPCAQPAAQVLPILKPGVEYFAGDDAFAVRLYSCQPLPPNTRLVASDAFLGRFRAEPPPRLVNHVLATSAALDPSHLPPAGREFARAYRSRYGEAPGRYAAYGYEAMAVVLDSIERASDPGDREGVIDAFLETEDRESVLGSYSIDELGDTTLDRLSGYRLELDAMVPVTELRAP